MDMTTLEDLLQSGDWEGLIGRSEDLRLEVKAQMYNLMEPEGRYELAKDVSAFANARGGLLLVGFATTRSEEKDEDVITALVAIPEEAFDLGQVGGVIREHVYPSIRGIRIEFLSTGQGEGVGLIGVPPQSIDRMPFLLTKVVEAGRYMKQLIAGYVERQQGRNEPLSPRALQQRMKKGSDTVAQRLGRLEDKMDELLDRSKPREEDAGLGEDRLRAHVEKVLEEDA